MEQYISKDTLAAEIKRIEHETNYEPFTDEVLGKRFVCRSLLSFIDNIEVKEVNEVPATVMVNKYGNRFISSWAGLKEYDDFKEGEKIKILISKK